MADKVQFILEDLLEESVYMMKKGVFSQGQLQQQMKKREKIQNNLVKSTHTLADHLQAIQFEYEQERIRKFREENAEQYKLDPKYKKANSKDFTIVKRIIQLWDRTMHRYRYRMDLWKQYLSFCFVIKSRKVFYKALSHAVKFNPFDLDLWLAGVYYEFEVVSNPWRARKVFHKALKINRKLPQFWIEYFRFEMQFAQKILQRQDIMKKEQNVQIIGVEGVDMQQELELEPEEINVKDIDFTKLLKAVVEQSLTAMSQQSQKQNIIREIIKIQNDPQWKDSIKPTVNELRQHIQKLVEEQQIVTQSPQETLKNLINLNYRKQCAKLRQELSKPQNFDQKFHQIQYFKKNTRKLLLNNLPMKELKLPQKVRVYIEWSNVMKEEKHIEESILKQCLSELSLKKQALGQIMSNILSIDPVMLHRHIINSRIQIPWQVTVFYLREAKTLSKMDMTELLRRTEQKAYENAQFLECLVRFNQGMGDIRSNLDLMKKVNGLYPQNKQLTSVLTGYMSR